MWGQGEGGVTHRVREGKQAPQDLPLRDGASWDEQGQAAAHPRVLGQGPESAPAPGHKSVPICLRGQSWGVWPTDPGVPPGLPKGGVRSADGRARARDARMTTPEEC